MKVISYLSFKHIKQYCVRNLVVYIRVDMTYLLCIPPGAESGNPQQKEGTRHGTLEAPPGGCCHPTSPPEEPDQQRTAVHSFEECSDRLPRRPLQGSRPREPGTTLSCLSQPVVQRTYIYRNVSESRECVCEMIAQCIHHGAMSTYIHVPSNSWLYGILLHCGISLIYVDTSGTT